MKDVALVGLPFSGKSTVFNAVARAHAATGGGAMKANLAVVDVPDSRVPELVALYKAKKQTLAQVRLVDVPGMSSLGEAREADALAVVLGVFGDDADPVRDLARFRAELAVADLSTIERAIDRAGKKAKTGERTALEEVELYKRAEAVLSDDRWLSEETWSADDARTIGLLTPLTMKPLLHVLNVDETASELPPVPSPSIVIRGLLEAEAADLEPDDAAALLSEFGVDESATERLVHAVYAVLDLITFFTAGEPEVAVRAVRRGTAAPQAAGTIHSDMEKGFIRAEVVSYDDLMATGSLDAAREKGLVRVEGKTYEVREGDIALIRFAN